MYGIRFRQLKTFSRTFFGFILFIVMTFFILFYRGHGFFAWFNAFSSCLFVALFAEANRNRLDKLILSFLFILEFWIYVNFILIIFIPKGMYYLENNNSYLNWVLGYKSSLQYYIFPALCFSWINMKYRNQRVRYFVLLAVSWASTIITSNTMLLVGLIGFTVFQFSRLWNMEKLFNIWTFYGIDIAANIVVVFFLSWFSSTTFGLKFFLLLGKNATISGRASIIWPMTIEYIQNHPFLGNGIYIAQSRITFYRNYHGFIHSHNQIMEILFIGGILLIGIYIYLHIHIGKSLRENSKTDVSKILSTSIFFLYLMMIVEVFTRIIAAPIWFILFLGGSSKLVHNSFIERKDCSYRES